VELSIYTVFGQRVQTLVSEDQEAGSHESRFDGAGFASGVYFYRLKAAGVVQTRKLMLLH
jgi:hypothetical protein